MHPNQSSSLEVCCLVYFSWDAMYNGGGNIEPSFLKSIMKSWFLLLSALFFDFSLTLRNSDKLLRNLGLLRAAQ